MSGGLCCTTRISPSRPAARCAPNSPGGILLLDGVYTPYQRYAQCLNILTTRATRGSNTSTVSNARRIFKPPRFGGSAWCFWVRAAAGPEASVATKTAMLTQTSALVQVSYLVEMQPVRRNASFSLPFLVFPPSKAQAFLCRTAGRLRWMSAGRAGSCRLTRWDARRRRRRRRRCGTQHNYVARCIVPVDALP